MCGMFFFRSVALNISGKQQISKYKCAIQSTKFTFTMHIVGKSLLLIIFLFSIEVRSEIFSAINELEKLVVKEKIIIDQLEILASQINHEYIER